MFTEFQAEIKQSWAVRQQSLMQCLDPVSELLRPLFSTVAVFFLFVFLKM